MAYLHENRELFSEAIDLTSEKFRVLPVVAEKDYYVTMILREFAGRFPFVVFKGGTSLSKCYKVIKRFSEDIDIAIDTKISQGQKKKLKENIGEIAETLGLKIRNIEEVRSRRNYNCYIFEYVPVTGGMDVSIPAAVLLETSFTEISFPTLILPVHSYIGDMMEMEAPEVMEEYQLNPFEMKLQGIDRTLIDKVFAICDYYLQKKVERHSRHIYDIYKLLPLVPQNIEFKKLVGEVRSVRAQTDICPSAKPEIDVPKLLKYLVEHETYKKDYELITSRILDEKIPYDEAIGAIKRIADSGMFEK